MADIQLRFNLDMLVLSTPVLRQLERIGIDTVRDNEMTLLLEPEVLDEIYALESAVGAQCIVADTASLTPARLAHTRMDARGKDLAEAAIAIANKCAPQHVLAEIGPCGLPLDASSKASLVENRDQYARAAAFFADVEPLFDAYFLNRFTSCSDLRCALMGLQKVTDKPIFASVDLTRNGLLDGPAAEPLSEAVHIMTEYGAQVVGFSTSCEPAQAVEFAAQARAVNPMMPVLAQLEIKDIDPEQNAPTEGNPYYEPDAMIDAADELKAAGVQFLRAVGNATPSYTGALVAATIGDNVNVPDLANPQRNVAADADLDELAATLRARISDALGN